MRLAIAEDSFLLREGIGQLLAAEGHDVILSVADAGALLRGLEGERPDLVIVDVRMPPDFVDEGIHAALRIRECWPEVGILVLSQVVERRHVRDLLDGRGGIGYLLKDRVSDIAGFLDAIKRVQAGGTAFDPEVIRQLLAARNGADATLGGLGGRERAVLELVAQGHSNAAIARRLHVSRSAVEKHIATIFDEFGLYADSTLNRRVLAVLAYLGAERPAEK
jgi:DNA-binding NarL/FixJ family response regulator